MNLCRLIGAQFPSEIVIAVVVQRTSKTAVGEFIDVKVEIVAGEPVAHLLRVGQAGEHVIVGGFFSQSAHI